MQSFVKPVPRLLKTPFAFFVLPRLPSYTFSLFHPISSRYPFSNSSSLLCTGALSQSLHVSCLPTDTTTHCSVGRFGLQSTAIRSIPLPRSWSLTRLHGRLIGAQKNATTWCTVAAKLRCHTMVYNASNWCLVYIAEKLGKCSDGSGKRGAKMNVWRESPVVQRLVSWWKRMPSFSRGASPASPLCGAVCA